MDPRELNEVWKAARKLQKSSSSIKSLLNQLIGLPPKKQAPEKYALELLISSLFEGPRVAEDLI